MDLNHIYSATTREQLLELAGKFARTGTNIFAKIDVIPDVITTSKVTALVFSPADLPLPLTYYSREKFNEISQDYTTYVKDLLQLSGFMFGDEPAKKAAATVTKIERLIADIHIKYRSEDNDIKYVGIKEASTTWKHIFKAYKQGMHLPNMKTKRWESKEEQVQVINSEFMDEMEHFVRNKIPLDGLTLYVGYRMLHSRVNWLSDEFRDAHFNFFSKKTLGHASVKHGVIFNLVGKKISDKVINFFGDRITGQVKKPHQTRRDFCAERAVEYFPQVIVGDLHTRLSEEKWEEFPQSFQDFVRERNSIRNCCERKRRTNNWTCRWDLTLRENIADNGGVSLAWDNYRSGMHERESESSIQPEVAGMMFFIAFAQSLCSKTRDKTMKERLRFHKTAPARYRVNGVVRNSIDFANAFGCKQKTPMNPTEKCKLW